MTARSSLQRPYGPVFQAARETPPGLLPLLCLARSAEMQLHQHFMMASWPPCILAQEWQSVALVYTLTVNHLNASR